MIWGSFFFFNLGMSFVTYTENCDRHGSGKPLSDYFLHVCLNLWDSLWLTITRQNCACSPHTLEKWAQWNRNLAGNFPFIPNNSLRALPGLTWNHPHRLMNPDHNLETTARGCHYTAPIARGNISVRQRTDDTSCPHLLPLSTSRLLCPRTAASPAEWSGRGVWLLPCAFPAASVLLQCAFLSRSLPPTPFFIPFLFFIPV